ncbi:MAG: tetratricopeptide repeat protein, partial [Verrucomicrobia bacterium]|nr:tetratricopeptide repeat protein [Verrucomicrobiota bacterium]
MNAPQPADNQTYDFFVSYARGDNANGWITRFIEELLAEHQQFAAGRTLKQFFDQHAITTGADWQLYLAHGIAHSRLFLAFISPNYLASEWCRKEWRAWIDAEIAQHILTAGVRPIYIVEVPGLTGRGQLSDQQLTQKLAELSRLPERDRNKLVAETPALLKHLRRRQHTHNQPFCDIHAFYDAGLDALRREDLRLVLTELAHDLDHHAELLARADASLSTVPAYNRNFTGRLDELLALRERLIKDDRTGVIYGVHGLGGIGKTELALAYAHAYASAYPGGRFLIRCENKASLRDAMLSQSDFTALFRDKIGDEERKQPDTYFAAVLACLRERLATLGHVLLVLDNVSDCALLEPEQTDTVTALGPKLHLLATTRLVPPTTGRSNWLSLGRLPDDDALDLLEKFRPFATDAERDAARRIVKRLGGFTLTVELVAAWLAKHRGTTFAAFLQRPGFESLEAFDLLAEEKDVKLRRHNDERRLAAVLDPTLDALAPAERRAMEYAALLPPDHVALPWLRALVGKDFPEFGVPPSAGSGFGVPPSGGPPTSEVPPSGGETTEPPKGGTPNPSFSNDNWLLLLDHLTGLTLFIRPETETTEPRLMTVHRLVQDRVRSRMAAPDLATRQQAVNALVKERDAALEKTNLWEDARWELEPFGALADLWAEAKHPWATWLLNQAGFRWHTLAEWNPCETAFRRALAIDEQSFGPEHPNVAIDLNNLAQLLKATNRLAEAEPLIRRALAIDEQSFGPEHPNVAIRLNNLATLLQDTNRLAEAEPLMRRVISIFEKSLGEDHPNVATSLNNLATLLQDTNRLAEAELLMRRALAIDEQSFGPEHPNVARDLNNLAGLLQDTNRLAEAEPLYRR